MTPLLALFDVDGTLFLTDDTIAAETFVRALRDVYGVDPPADAVTRTDHPGQTSMRIARLVLQAEGLDDAAIDARLRVWCDRFARCYEAGLHDFDTSHWQLAPGAAESLDRIAGAGIQLALLTGNPEPVARLRMVRLGLERFFPRDRGAFGCDGEDRLALIDLARERAGGWPADRTVEIGDTPRDVSSAHAAGIRAIALGSPGTAESADAFCDNLAEVADLLIAWNRGP